MRFEIKAAIGGLVLSYAFHHKPRESRGFSTIRAIRSLASFPLSSDLLFDILHEPPRRVASAQLAVRRRKAGISRTFSSIKFRARSGRTDRGPEEPHGAHIPNSGLPAALPAGGRLGGPADSLTAAAAVHYARSG